jgi:triosephosphate isomerase (TIM)
MRRKLVVGNWKMNLTRAEAAPLVEEILNLLENKTTCDVGICPSFLSIPMVRDAVRRSSIGVGAQDVFWMESGAFTGSISATMLRDAGCKYAIVGHSETRGKFGKLEVPESTLPYFGETDQTVNLKIKALLYHSLVPILCVGETLAEREAGTTDAIIEAQLRGALEGIEGAEFFEGVVAYEPVWAIGTGKTCEADEASRVCGFIRRVLAEVLDEHAASSIRVLYGGSVKASNAAELFHQPDIDGGLVGGASLKAEEFSKVVLAAN